MDIYQDAPKEFIPTYLYIKQHDITKKLYFGKTINDPETYPGSGSHWRNHIRIHGRKHVKTLWYCLFYDEETINEFALLCSKQWNIVESIEWLNKINEDGKGGGAPKGTPSHMKGTTHTEESKEKNRIAHLGKKDSPETIEKKRASSTGREHTEATKQQIKETLTGVKHDIERVEKMRKSKTGKKSGPYKTDVCPHCGEEGAANLMHRYHFDNCPNNPDIISGAKIDTSDRAAKKEIKFFEGKHHSEESNEKNRVAHTGKKHSEESKAAIVAALLGRPCSEETRAKIGAGTRGKKHSDEHRKKNSENRKGKGTGPRATCECPNCHKVGGIGLMKRYHFDNCKQLTIDINSRIHQI